MIHFPLAAVLETALNRYISLDNQVGERLKPLVGKTIAITVTPFNSTVYLQATETMVQVTANCPPVVDTYLTGSLWAFGWMGFAGKPMRVLFAGQVALEGDVEVGRKFQTLLARLDINWERQLAQLTGEPIAGHLIALVRTGLIWNQQALTALRLDTVEFLQEETRDLPAVSEAEHFYQAVDKLRLDFDRLEQRIVRLEMLR
jgi:ubiquinone biosynthesis protein UbiJ